MDDVIRLVGGADRIIEESAISAPGAIEDVGQQPNITITTTLRTTCWTCGFTCGDCNTVAC